MMKEKIILASGSPRRKELLEQAGISFEVMVSDAREEITSEDPGEVVKELSFAKAAAVAGQAGNESRLVLGADTVVVSDGRILGKPADEKEAVSMIRSLSGRSHQVYTGVTLIRGGNGISFYEVSDVEVYPMTEEEIASYVETKEPMDKAGAYGIQGRFAIYIKGIRGDYNNIVGLPVARVYQELKKIMK